MLAQEIIRKKPEDTLRDVKPYANDAGVTRVSDITGMDRIGIPVYAAIRPDSKSLAVDSGKGLDKEQAQCSAVMEAIERWAHDEYLLKWEVGPAAPHSIYKFPMVQGAVFNWHLEHKWVEAEYWSGGKVMVPYYHVFNYEKKLPLQEMCWQSGTNGLAAGNTREEAILQGLYEIIERDAVTLWMTRGARGGSTKRIDVHSITDKVAHNLLTMCWDAGVEACVYEATTDIGIPVYICLMVDYRADIGVYKGYGCSLDSGIAMQRAICEAAQGRAVFLSGGRDDMRWSKHTRETNNRQRLAELAAESKISYLPFSPENILDSEKIGILEDALVSHGCGNVIVADIMAREHAYVVKVMSEHLEGYWNPYLQLGKRAKA